MSAEFSIIILITVSIRVCELCTYSPLPDNNNNNNKFSPCVRSSNFLEPVDQFFQPFL